MKVDLNNAAHIEKYGKDVKNIIITSTNGTNLSKINPFKVAKEIGELCGEVESVQLLKSGSLLVNTRNKEQAQVLLQQKTLKVSCTPVNVAIVWHKQFSYGKIYAPEFQDEPLEYLLEILQDTGVVGIRKLSTKLSTDSSKAHISLYVLTFIAKTCSSKIKVGYCYYNVDKFYPSPLRCGKCCRWGHSAQYCRRALMLPMWGEGTQTRELSISDNKVHKLWRGT